MKSLVIYHTITGNTERVGKIIAEKTGSDILKINPEESIKKGFLSVMGETVSQMVNPKHSVENLNFEKYGRIYIGSPCWAYTVTPAVKKFIQDTDFSGKEIIVFISHDGGLGKTQERAQKLLGDTPISKFMDFAFVKKTDAAALKVTVLNKLEELGI